LCYGDGGGGKTMKVALYSRVSTLDKGQDTENQLIQLRAYCQRQGWEIVKEYTDKVSGGKGREKRPQFSMMLHEARLKHFDAVLVWALDRFSREGVAKTFEYIRELDSYGVKFISHQERYFDTMGVWKEAVMAIMATLAELERSRMSERVKAGLERTKSKGTKLGRPKVAKRKKEDKIHTLRDTGMSIRKIAKELNVGKATVERVLTN